MRLEDRQAYMARKNEEVRPDEMEIVLPGTCLRRNIIPSTLRHALARRRIRPTTLARKALISLEQAKAFYKGCTDPETLWKVADAYLALNVLKKGLSWNQKPFWEYQAAGPDIENLELEPIYVHAKEVN